MSRRNEDFDEFCDPDNPKIIKYEEVVDAAARLRPFIIRTQCVPSQCQRQFVMNLYYKPEFLQKSGSFKERGALNALQLLPTDKKKIGIVIASIGNDAVGLCYYAAKMNIPVIVVLPVTVPISKLQKCHSMGAKVVVQGMNLMDAQKYARAIARDKGLTYINGRDHPHILAGYGTIALEILEDLPIVDAIIVPVGSGGLLGAIARVVKHVKPKCLVYGVQPEIAAPFFKSLEMEQITSVPMGATVADGISVPNVGVNAFANAQPIADKMLLVNEDWITRSILHLVQNEKYVVEGAGACTLATIIGNLVPELKLKHVVCILSGGNIENIMLSRCLERGLSAEGLLVKFSALKLLIFMKLGVTDRHIKSLGTSAFLHYFIPINGVGIENSPTARTQLMRLLANGGYNLVSTFQDGSWLDDDGYTIEIKLVCETKNLEHALELKRIMERAYPCTTVFETEPFSDKRTCPCYVRKSMP